MILTSASAYVPKRLGGDGLPATESPSSLRVETAILMDENGTPRCRIGKHPSEYLTAEQLGEFYREEAAVATLDALEECDQSDELYARVALQAEEMNLAGAAAPTSLVGGLALSWLANLTLGVVGGCVSFKLLEKIDDQSQKAAVWSQVGVWSVSGIMSTLATAALLKSGVYVLIVGIVGFGPGGILGFTACPV